MLKKSITYTDFNGNTVTDVFYFNLTKTELMKMELSEADGFSEMMQRIVDAKNNGEIVAVFEKIIMTAYGEKSNDGKSFLKLDDNGNPLSAKFAQTAAYDAMFFQFVENQDDAEAFIRGIMPAGFEQLKSTQDQVNEALAKNGLPAITAEAFQPVMPPPPTPSI